MGEGVVRVNNTLSMTSVTQSNNDRAEARRSRVYWQCRRGMLELDLLLQGFFDEHYDRLAPSQRQAFEALLGYPDPLLYEYFLGRTIPADGAIADVVAKIRGPADA